MLRVVFMGTPEFAVPVLEALHPLHSIVGVYTQPDRPVGRGLEKRASPVKVKALEFGLSVFQPEKLSQLGEFENLELLRPDIIVVVAYGQILKKNVLEVAKLGCVNIHSSLLPRWRGAAPIQWAILAGDAESGVCTQKMVEKLDAGDLLMEARTTLDPRETAETLHDRLSQMAAQIIIPTFEGLEKGTLIGKPQDEQKMTYATKLTKEMEFLNPEESAEVLDRKIRALNPWPGTSLWVDIGKMPGAHPLRLKIKKGRPRSDLSGPCGKIFERSGMILLGTRQGSLELIQLQWEGKKETDSGGFMNGLKGRGQELPLTVVTQ